MKKTILLFYTLPIITGIILPTPPYNTLDIMLKHNPILLFSIIPFIFTSLLATIFLFFGEWISLFNFCTEQPDFTIWKTNLSAIDKNKRFKFIIMIIQPIGHFIFTYLYPLYGYYLTTYIISSIIFFFYIQYHKDKYTEKSKMSKL